MTDRDQSGVDWEDDEFLFAVEGLNDEEEQGKDARPAAGSRPAPPRPPEAGLTNFFGSTKGSEAERDDPRSREEASLSGLMGGDAHAAPGSASRPGARPEASLGEHFGEPEHPLASDDSWEGAPHEQPASLRQSFQPAHAASEQGAEDGSDGWGFENGGAPAAPTEEETFAFVDEGDAAHASRIDHGFQGGPPAQPRVASERLRTAPLGAVANARTEGVVDDDFAGDDSEVVSWSDARGGSADEGAEEYAGESSDEQEEAAYAAEASAASTAGESFADDDAGSTAHASPERSASRKARTGKRTRRLLVLGSVVLAAALAALATPKILEMLPKDDPAANARNAAARTAKATPKGVKAEPKGEATPPAPVAENGTKEPEVAQAQDPDPVPPVAAETSNPTAEVTPPVDPTNVAQAEVSPVEATPTEQLPTLSNSSSPEGTIGIGAELALQGEAVPNAAEPNGEGETSEPFTPGEDRPIPATAWADMGGAVPAGDTVLRQSKVRVQLRNGAEFDGQLRKIDDAAVELKLEQGTVVFLFEELHEIVPLEAAGARISEYPEGYVEFRSTARIWGRIVADLPTHVTLAFGPANLNIPKRSVKLVQEQPMSTILLGGAKSN